MAKSQKLVLCRNCNTAIPKGAQKCHACGAKNKKPFYKRVWFIGLVVIILISSIGSGLGRPRKTRIVWEDMELGHLIPEPPARRGRIYANSDTQLRIDYDDISDDEYNDYLDECIDEGFTIDATKNSSSYKAYSDDGYCLHISHHDDDLSINLVAPMEFVTIVWPDSIAGNQIPAPKSDLGKFNYEYEDNFYVYIGNTSREDYNEYVAACRERGFTIDYNKGDDYYYADNADGWHISIRYEGNNVMSIDIDAPDEEDSSVSSTDSNEDNDQESTSQSQETDSTESDDVELINGMRPEFKEAMDAYEDFMNEYCDFMEQYLASDGTDAELLTEYYTYMSKYYDVLEAFEAWDGEDLNDAEAAYYIEVQTRVNARLYEIAS